MHYRPWIRIVGPLLVFAVVGTIGLVLLLNSAFQGRQHSEFAALAEADADYIRDSLDAEKLSGAGRISDRGAAQFARDIQTFQAEFLADHRNQFLGVSVQFQRVSAPDVRHEAVTAPINSETELTLMRTRPQLVDALLQPIAIGAVMAFWALWFALAWAVMSPYLAAQRFGLLGSIAASLAHEIRNPIAAIRLHGELLEKSEPVSAGLIVYEASKIEDKLNQWMFLTRPEPPQKTEVELAELIGKTIQVLTPAAEHALVRITVTAAPSRRIQADVPRLAQVFHNIILNAIQAMPLGGTLAVSISEIDVCFTDTGPGFSPTALRRAAQTLYSEKEGGMGLGLGVARKIVRAHNGTLMLSNQPSGGAVVRVML